MTRDYQPKPNHGRGKWSQQYLEKNGLFLLAFHGIKRVVGLKNTLFLGILQEATVQFPYFTLSLIPQIETVLNKCECYNSITKNELTK